MRIRYFEDTDTLLIEFREVPVAQARDLDDNTVADFDETGNVCAITMERASERASVRRFSFEQVCA